MRTISLFVLFLFLLHPLSESFEQVHIGEKEIIIQGPFSLDDVSIGQREEITSLFLDALVDDEFVAQLAEFFPNLRSLFLYGDLLTHSSLQIFSDEFPCLRTLHLSAKNGQGVFTDEGLDILAERKRPLHYLHLAGHPSFTQEGIDRFIQKVKEQEEKRFVPEVWFFDQENGCHSQKRELEELLIQYIEGRYIFKKCSEMALSDVGYLSPSLGFLHEFAVFGMITDDDLEFLLPLIKQKEHVRLLNLASPFLTDRALMQLGVFSEIQEIALMSPWITDQGLIQLCSCLPRLEEIDIDGMGESPLEWESIDALEEMFPFVEFWAFNLS